jgi:hypothetical protein
MGYPVRIQKVERPTNRSYYVNFPLAMAEALAIEKGEEFEWLIEDKNTLILRRVNKRNNLKFKTL